LKGFAQLSESSNTSVPIVDLRKCQQEQLVVSSVGAWKKSTYLRLFMVGRNLGIARFRSAHQT
jgi:hypothetical protein